MASVEILNQKKQIVEDIKSKISAAKGLVIVDYIGLTVEEDTAMRRELRNAGLDYGVLKNRLVQRAFNELKFTDFDKHLEGPSALAFSATDSIAPAKAVFECVKKYPKMKIKCGMVDGQYVDDKLVEKYAALPSKEQLIAGLACGLNSLIAGLAICLNRVSEQKANN